MADTSERPSAALISDRILCVFSSCQQSDGTRNNGAQMELSWRQILFSDLIWRDLNTRLSLENTNMRHWCFVLAWLCENMKQKREEQLGALVSFSRGCWALHTRFFLLIPAALTLYTGYHKGENSHLGLRDWVLMWSFNLQRVSYFMWCLDGAVQVGNSAQADNCYIATGAEISLLG